MFHRVLLIVFIISYFVVISNCQSFCGSIYYTFELKDLESATQASGLDILGIDTWNSGLQKSYEYHINADSLLFVSKRRSGEIFMFTKQVGDFGYVQLRESGKEWSFEKDPVMQMQDLVLEKKTKEKKDILGITCRKYIYHSPDQSMTMEAWITDLLPYDSEIQTQKYFGRIFTKDGLILELTKDWGVAKHHIKATRIVLNHQLPVEARGLLKKI